MSEPSELSAERQGEVKRRGLSFEPARRLNLALNMTDTQEISTSETVEYVGTLHEINSENATVALENVKSYGTENRKSPEDFIPPSDNFYEYIVFRGSDVKDLRIEEAPSAAKENKPPVPNDPAIMSSSGSRPPPQQQQAPAPVQRETPQQGPAPAQPPVSQSQSQNAPPPFTHHPQYPPFYPPPPAGWGRGGLPGPPFPGAPYGGPPPGWFPPQGQGFPPGPFPPYGYPPGPPGPLSQQFPQGQQGQQQGQKPAPIGPSGSKQTSPPPSALDKQPEPKSLAKPAAEMAAATVIKAPASTAEQKQPPADVKPAAEASSQATQAAAATKASQPTTKGNRIQPAIPLPSPAAAKASSANVSQQASSGTASLRDATQAATAAVAAAMAKLPAVTQTNGNANGIDNLTKKVNELRTTEPDRAPRQPSGSGGFAPRGGRGGRGGAARNASQKVEVPATDFDFESSNAKFNKEDLVKEAIAGSPLGEKEVASPIEPEAPATYNKATSFFDNISSDSKDRAESNGGRPGGREWRGEEQKKNVETFGEGSVDNGGYRGGYRGRGRGRGRGGFRGGRGYGGQNRGGYRGRGDSQAAQQ
ncbi:Scd6-like Sm domain-containing protein [Bisporella sp. PMI_857]|nr:Scd6-like Sm domain-containing protein [Bisporella sp. PMI_857]